MFQYVCACACVCMYVCKHMYVCVYTCVSVFYCLVLKQMWEPSVQIRLSTKLLVHYLHVQSI